MKKEPKLDVKLACRNLWNLYALNHRSEVGLKLFSEILLRVGDAYTHTEVDLATAVKCFAHFQYKDEACIELLLRHTIRQADDMSVRSLASIVKSFADLGNAHPTLMGITREILLKTIDAKAAHLSEVDVDEVQPTDCTQLM